MVHNKLLTKQSVHSIYSKYVPHWETLETTQTSSIEWKVKPMATYQCRGSFYCHHKEEDVECEVIRKHEPRSDAKVHNKKDVHTDPNYTEICMWKLPGIRMWAWTQKDSFYLTSPIKIQDLIKSHTIGSYFYSFISMGLLIINTEFLQNACSQFNMWPILKNMPSRCLWWKWMPYWKKTPIYLPG